MKENKTDKTFSTDLGDNKVIIGNPKDPSKLSPQVDFPVFGEHTISVKYEKEYASQKLDGDSVVLEDADDSFYAVKHDEDTFKFGLIFKAKPNTNSFSMKLEGWEDFDFFFQPPLANTDPDGSTWENNDRGGVSRRPADVNGSYAVYHKTKRDHILGQTNYATGKAFHIYRPRFIDANGDFVWVDLHIENGDYTITIPQDFLDKAVYPIRANDTFGYTSVGASDDNGNTDNYLATKPFSTPASNGTLTNLTMAAYDPGGDSHLKMAIYSETLGEPVTLLSNSGTGAVTVTRTTAPTSTLSTWAQGSTGSASIVASTNYWATFITDDDTVHNMYDTATNELRNKFGSGFYAAFPAATFPIAPATNSLRISIYATYTPSGGATVRPPKMALMGIGS